MSEQPSRLPHPPLDGTGGGDYFGVMEERIKRLEDKQAEILDRLARIEARLDTFATKADLHAAMNSQTWKLVTFTCGYGSALVAATFFIARYVVP